MLVARSYLLVKEGLERPFAEMMEEKALPLLRGVDGADAISFGGGVEHPDKFMLLIEWRDMDAHVAFTKLPVSGEFCAMLSPFTKGGEMEHFEMR